MVHAPGEGFNPGRIGRRRRRPQRGGPAARGPSGRADPRGGARGHPATGGARDGVGTRRGGPALASLATPG